MASGRPRPAPERALRTDRTPPPPDLDRARVAVVRRARAGGGPDAGTEQRDEDPFRRAPATSPTVVMPREWSFSAVFRPTPQSRSTGSGWRNACSSSGGTTSRPSGFDTALATLARNFVRATPTEIGSPTLVGDLAPELHCDLGRGAGHPPEPTDIEEGLVDRDVPRRAGSCSRTPRTPPRSRRCTRRTGAGRRSRRGQSRRAWREPHRGAHAEALRLVAGREDDSAADDHRPAPQPGVVPLLDRREEGVEVGVEDRRVGHEHMFVHGSDDAQPLGRRGS